MRTYNQEIEPLLKMPCTGIHASIEDGVALSST